MLRQEEWALVEEGIATDPARASHHETLFCVGNGLIGVRGSLDEAPGDSTPSSLSPTTPSSKAAVGSRSTYMNGVYDEKSVPQATQREYAAGRSNSRQSMVPVFDASTIEVTVQGMKLSPISGEFKDHVRTLDFKTGALHRRGRWRSPDGGIMVQIESTRVALVDHPHVVAFHYHLKLLEFKSMVRDGRCDVVVTSKVKLPSGRHLSLRLAEHDCLDNAAVTLCELRTSTSCVDVQCCAYHECEVSGSADGIVSSPARRGSGSSATKVYITPSTTAGDDGTSTSFHARIAAGATMTLTKLAHYSSNLEGALRYDAAEVLEPRHVKAKLQGLAREGIPSLLHTQRESLSRFWTNADINIVGSLTAQSTLRFNSLQLYMSAGRTRGTNFAAKGLTGELFGHYSWDIEIFMFPFFVFNDPDVAKAMIQYRIDTLEDALDRAQDLHLQRGALYPFRTLNGSESHASTACTMQLHMNADIAYAIQLWLEVTGDYELMRTGGAAVVLATALVWIQWGIWDEGDFHLRHVTGPDEYNVLVNDNYYTNLMAQNHLVFAYNIAKEFQHRFAEEYEALCGIIGLKQEDVEAMREAAEHMALPYDSKRHIHLQEESFLKKHPWAFQSTGTPNTAAAGSNAGKNLMEGYHPLTIYRHRVCKQADIILCQVLLGSKFTRDDKIANFNFYESLTTHDSSLTPSTFSIMAAELGMRAKAYEYFERSLMVDVANVVGNTSAGMHAACMAGSWSCIVRGFAGMRTQDGGLIFNPYLPDQWEEYSFRVKYAGSVVSVNVGRRAVTYRALEGTKCRITHGITSIHLTKGKAVSVPLHAEVRSLEFEGVILDSGCLFSIPDTAQHYCWKVVLEEFIEAVPPTARTGTLEPFDFTFDKYLAYIKHHPTASGPARLIGLHQLLSRWVSRMPYTEDDRSSTPSGTTIPPPFATSPPAGYIPAITQLEERHGDVLCEYIIAQGLLRPEPGAEEFLSELKRSGVFVGCASPHTKARKLLKHCFPTIPFDCCMDAGATAQEGGLEWQPEPQFFERCAAKLCTAVQRMVIVVKDHTGFSRQALGQFSLAVSLTPEIPISKPRLSTTVHISSLATLKTDDLDRFCEERRTAQGALLGIAPGRGGSTPGDTPTQPPGASGLPASSSLGASFPSVIYS